MGFADSPLKMFEATKNAMTSKRRKRIWFRIALSILALVFLLVLLHGIPIISPRSIDAEIDKNLGQRSDVSAVLHFLDTRGFPHSGYIPEFRRVYAEVNRSSIGLMKGHIHMEFNFNEDGKLVSHKVHELLQFAWE